MSPYKSFLILGILLCVKLPLSAYVGYEPPVDGRPLDLKKNEIKWKDKDRHSAVTQCNGSTIEFDYNRYGSSLILRQGGVTEKFIIGETPMLGDISCYDLNGDKKDDFIIPFWGGGCGMAALYIDVLFLVSGPNNYEGSVINTMDPANLFISKDGQVKFIYKQDAYATTDFDHKGHTFWVYHFLGFDRQNLRLLPDKPVWIMFTNKPNHTPTNKLTEAQKNAAWAEHEKFNGPLKIIKIMPNQSLRWTRFKNWLSEFISRWKPRK